MSRHDRQCGRTRRGFTLVELLIAIIILLVGVVAALRIFPPGFAAFSEAQMDNTAQAHVDNWLNAIEDDPDSLPDAILPVDMAGADAIAGALDFADLTAVDCQNSAAAWVTGHYYALTDGMASADPWPLWQPLSARIFRRVVGEKVVVPSEVSELVSGNTNYTLPRFTTYTPRFAPLEANSTLLVYDLRYRQVDAGAIATGSAEAPVYARAIDTGANTFTLTIPDVPDLTHHYLRVSFSCINGANQVVQVMPAVWQIPGPGPYPASPFQGQQTVAGTPVTMTPSTILVGSLTTYAARFQLPAGWNLIAGSEQVNRAYEFVDTTNLATMASLQPGQFALYTAPNPQSRYRNIAHTLLAMLVFARDDGGRKVKIDYTVADWNILHEDVTIEDDGYFSLSGVAPKVQNRPNFPREPRTWGLFEPMHAGTSSVVMALLDQYQGDCYSVEYDPARPNQDIGPEQKGYYVGPLVLKTAPVPLVIDMGDTKRGRVRLGVRQYDTVGNRYYVDWGALAGQTFRVYFRGQRDWTVQFFRAPAAFGHASDKDHLGWNCFALEGNRVSVPRIYASQTIAVDYLYRDLCQVVEDSTGNSVKVDNVGLLSAGAVQFYDATGAARVAATITAIDADARTVQLDGSYTVERGWYLVDPGDTRLRRISGETHVVPSAQSGQAYGTCTLKHLPASNTAMTVRGISISVRTLWTQPRRGTAYTVTDSAFLPPTRPLGERWQAKTVTLTLPLDEH